jgi:thiol-disulfide isomerase/thioredoxin
MERMKLRRAHVLVLGVLLCVLVLAGLLTWYLRYAHVRDEVGTAASSVLKESAQTPYTTLSGEPFSFEDYRGKIRVVNVWASWSPFAQTELPLLNTIANEFADKNVVAIAINRKEQRDRAAAYIGTLGDLPRLIYAIDETDAFYTSVGGYAMPETLIFDTAGNIVWHYRGVASYDSIAEQLNKLIQ